MKTFLAVDVGAFLDTDCMFPVHRGVKTRPASLRGATIYTYTLHIPHQETLENVFSFYCNNHTHKHFSGPRSDFGHLGHYKN